MNYEGLQIRGKTLEKIFGEKTFSTISLLIARFNQNLPFRLRYGLDPGPDSCQFKISTGARIPVSFEIATGSDFAIAPHRARISHTANSELRYLRALFISVVTEERVIKSNPPPDSILAGRKKG